VWLPSCRSTCLPPLSYVRFGLTPSPGAHIQLQLTRWSSCTPLRSLACLAFPDQRSRPLKRNKAVLNSSPDIPLVFLFLQLLIAVFLLHVATLFSSRIEIPHWDWYTAKKLFPVIAINVIGLVFNTLCLREVEATFFQVTYHPFIILVVQLRHSPQIARGLVLPLTIAITPTRFHPQQAARVVLAAGLVTIGFFIGVIPEGNLPISSIPSPRSLVFGVFSSLSIAIHSVLVKSSLSYCNNSTIQLAYWTNAVSAILLAPFVFLRGEHVKIVELSVSSEWNMNVFIVGSLVTGSFGFLLCVAGLLSIKVTSPVTHMFSSVRSHPSHFSCHDIHRSSLGSSLRHSNAFGGLDISRCVDRVRHPPQ
jgi:GDP-fucose transporter C1